MDRGPLSGDGCVRIPEEIVEIHGDPWEQVLRLDLQEGKAVARARVEIEIIRDKAYRREGLFHKARNRIGHVTQPQLSSAQTSPELRFVHCELTPAKRKRAVTRISGLGQTGGGIKSDDRDRQVPQTFYDSRMFL